VTTSSAVAVDEEKKKEDDAKKMRDAADKSKKAKPQDKSPAASAKAAHAAQSDTNQNDNDGGMNCYSILKGRIVKTMMIEFPVVEDMALLQHVFALNGRTLTSAQYQLLQQSMRQFPRIQAPIVAAILVQRFIDWPSYTAMPIATASSDDPDDDNPFIDIRSINALCCQLFMFLEERHGRQLMRAALAFISLARFGVSETELFELLSLSDDVLAEV